MAYKYPRTINGKITPTYRAYRDMHNRCYYKLHNRYSRYGGRGIIVCDRWLQSYDDFVDDLGQRPLGLQLDRVNNDGNYEPSNCRWASASDQALNRSTTRVISFNGVTKSIREWSDTTGIPYATLERRINSSRSTIESALTSPVRHLKTQGPKLITFNDKTLRLSEWCKLLGLTYATVNARLKQGWSVEKAFNTQVWR